MLFLFGYDLIFYLYYIGLCHWIVSLLLLLLLLACCFYVLLHRVLVEGRSESCGLFLHADWVGGQAGPAAGAGRLLFTIVSDREVVLLVVLLDQVYHILCLIPSSSLSNYFQL